MEDLRIRFNQYNELYSNDTEFKKDVYLYTGDAYYKAGDPERFESIYKYRSYIKFDVNIIRTKEI